jgi:hypothetical protein
MTPTKEQVEALIKATKAIADSIKELKRVPSGELYARLMNYVSLQQYEQLISVLEKAGLIEIVNHEIIWIEQ